MVLYINACVRKESRTNRIAECLLEKLGGEYEEGKLLERGLKPLSYFGIRKTELIKAEMLDVVGYDAETIVGQVIQDIRK